LGVDTGKIRAPYYFSAVELGDGFYRLFECTNVNMAFESYDESVKQAGSQNKFGILPKVGIRICSLCGLDYSTDQCVEVPQEQSREVAKIINISYDKVVHTLSDIELAPIKIGGTPEITPLSPLNSPTNKFTDVSNW
jgi:hypothetical protein